jgi:uncharacterized LabA/DUF88 family protein
MSDSERRVYVFIDAANLWEAQKTKGKMLDFEHLIAYLTKRYKATELKVFYYTAYPGEGTRDYDTSGRFKFFTYLKKKLGIVVVMKELKRIATTDSRFADGFIEKGNMDVELAIDAVNIVQQYDTAILFTGDSDFLALVKFIRARGKKAYIYSSRNNVSSELRTGGDGYVDVPSLDSNVWGRDMVYRDQKSK